MHPTTRSAAATARMASRWSSGTPNA
jgi:hypothetical protein